MDKNNSTEFWLLVGREITNKRHLKRLYITSNIGNTRVLVPSEFNRFTQSNSVLNVKFYSNQLTGVGMSLKELPTYCNGVQVGGADEQYIINKCAPLINEAQRKIDEVNGKKERQAQLKSGYTAYLNKCISNFKSETFKILNTHMDDSLSARITITGDNDNTITIYFRLDLIKGIIMFSAKSNNDLVKGTSNISEEDSNEFCKYLIDHFGLKSETAKKIEKQEKKEEKARIEEEKAQIEQEKAYEKELESQETKENNHGCEIIDDDEDESDMICLDANNAEDEIIDDDEDESDMIQIDDAEESSSKEQQDEEKEQLKNEIPTREEVLARNELFVDSMVNFVQTKLNENGIKATAEEIRNFYNKNIKTNLIMCNSDNYIEARAKNGHFVKVMMLPEGNEDILSLFVSVHTMKLKRAEKDKIDAIHKLVREDLNKLRTIDRDIKHNAKTKENVNKLVSQADHTSERVELDLYMEFEQLKFTLTPGWNLPDIQATDRDIQKVYDLEREIRVHAEEIKKKLHDNKNKLTQEEYEKAYEDLKDQLNRIDSDIELNKECIKNRKKAIIDETPGLCDLKIDIPDKYDFFDEAETIYVDEDNILTRAIHSLLDQIYYCTENMYRANTFRELEDSIDEGDL